MRISDWSSDVCSSDLPGPVVDQFIAKGRVQMALSHCHAHCGGKPLPQRASRRLNARQLKIFRMARAGAVELTKVADVLQGRPGVTRQMKERVDQHRPTPSRQHETIAVGPARRLGTRTEAP